MTILPQTKSTDKAEPELEAFARRVDGKLMGFRQKNIYRCRCFRCGGDAFFSPVWFFCRRCWTDIPLTEAAQLLGRIKGVGK